jgi:hypothetical protein
MANTLIYLTQNIGIWHLSVFAHELFSNANLINFDSKMNVTIHKVTQEACKSKMVAVVW